MDLLLIRHGIAAGNGEWEGDDASRPLTEKGKKRAAEVFRGLKRHYGKLDLIVYSPYRRARETSELLALEYPSAANVQLDAVTPFDDPAAFLDFLRGREEKRVALVGHEPHLSSLLSLCLFGENGPVVTHLKKASATLLFCELDKMEAGGAELVWSLPPAISRSVGEEIRP